MCAEPWHSRPEKIGFVTWCIITGGNYTPGETLIVYFSSTTLGPQCYSKDQAHQLSKQFAIFTFYQTKTLMFIG